MQCVTVSLSRYKAASILRMYNKMITMRLLWVLDNVEGLREAADRNEVSSRPGSRLWNSD